jgi:hypothetical protein
MLTQEDIEKLQAQHGLVIHCKGRVVEDSDGKKYNQWEIVLKKPARKDYLVWLDMINDEKKKPGASSFIVRKMLAYPELAGFDALLEEHYGICQTTVVQKAIATFCGLDAEESGK